ncbi:MAG TPA: sodium:proton antiporter [Rhodospirillaceae bacterium]|nr:sodium:proton antiporter [Rhodospirillaceae bacterium]
MLEAASWAGPAILIVFVIAYLLVFGEEKLHLRKSKPVMVGAGLIWIIVAIAFHQAGRGHEVSEKLRHVLLEYAELFLFLLAAMSFVNTMVERNVFESLRTRLVAARLSIRNVFWITGTFAFFLSPIADNLTTALVMGTVVLSTFAHRKKLAVGALINVVVAANAGGAFSPFGDITTLMVWQKGMVEFGQFFSLFFPALVNWLVPAFIISFTLPKRKSRATAKIAEVHKGGYVVVCLFLATIATTVTLDNVLHLPPFLGMMMGLGVLEMYGYFLRASETRAFSKVLNEATGGVKENLCKPRKPFDIFCVLEKVEWDTLLFFYGIMLCVGGISAIGYLGQLSTLMYTDLGPTIANISVGLLSSIIDNIPVTFAVLTMSPTMDLGQWLLLTLTAGVGGSLLSIGSAAGVALMGIGKGSYTFLSHLRWTWAIFLGFAASVGTHLLINHALFTG